MLPETRHIINASRLAAMKQTAYLINVSRGPLIDSVALAHELANNGIAGAAVDVLEEEPPPIDDPLLSAPRMILSNHVAWYSEESERRLRDLLSDRCAAVLVREPASSVVNAAGLQALAVSAE